MAKVTPDQLFSGITVTATEVTIPIAALPGVTQAEIAATTGDGAVLMRGLVEGAYAAIQGITAADRPTRFTLTKGTQTITPGVANAIRQPYTAQFDITANSFEVVAE